MAVYQGLDEVEAAVGSDLGAGEWLEITQDRIDAFADATGDHQWIHVDPERAKDGPFGATIAHGYLTLSLLPLLGADLLKVEGTKMAINYGLNKLRFPSPVRVGSRVRAAGKLTSFERTANGARIVVTVTIETEGEPKPAAIAETIRQVVV
ncbi:MAG TPA: MaoC family dehydratase [Aldersonia sp.]